MKSNLISEAQFVGNDTVWTWFRFTYNTTNNPVLSAVAGPGKAIVRSLVYGAVGLITVTLEESVVALAAFPSVDDASGNRSVTASDYTNENTTSRPTFKIRLKDAAGAEVAPGTQVCRVLLGIQNSKPRAAANA
jgi:hypothetical protein